MSFLNPVLLFAAAAIGVPILIHWLSRRRFQRVVWAAMRFLKLSVEQNQRRMRMEDMILLALRCLLVLLLALGLARPALRSSVTHLLGAKVTGVLILDNSYSMSQTDGVSSRFAKAKQAAEQALEAMRAGSSVALFLASDTVNALVPEPTLDANLVRKLVRDARLSDRATDLLPAVKRAVDLLRKSRGVREICLVTDNQALGWRQMPEILQVLELAKKEQIQVRIVIVGEREDRNLGVSRVLLASGLTPLHQPLRVEAQISNYGREEVKSIKVSLSVDGELPMDEAYLDALPAGASKGVSLFARLHTPGFHAITVRLPEDRVPADDKRTLAVRAIQEVRVLLVDGDPGREPRESQVFFLRHALQPVPVAEASQYFIKTTTIPSPEISNARLDDYDAVVLANVTELPANLISPLQQYLRRGGGLMVFPGPNVATNFYNDVLLAQTHILPAAYGPLRASDKPDQYLTLQEKDYAHPVVEIWNDPGAGTLGSARFFRAYELRPDDWKQSGLVKVGRREDAGEPRVVLRLADGSPAVMERAWGLGRVMQFNSTANTLWNDLAVRPAFLPLMHRALGALVQRQDEGLNLRVGDRFAYRLGNELLGRDVVVVPPGADKNQQRDLRRVELVGGQPMLAYEATDFSGVYEATIAGDLARPVKFAAQPDAHESDLSELSDAQARMIEGLAPIYRWKPGMVLRETMDKERMGTELWLPLLILVLLLAMVETFLAQWFSRTK